MHKTHTVSTHPLSLYSSTLRYFRNVCYHNIKSSNFSQQQDTTAILKCSTITNATKASDVKMIKTFWVER